MEVICPFWNGSWRCRLCMLGSTLQNLWKQSNAKCRKVVRWTKPWRRGPFWRECSSPLIHCLAGAKKESKHCISLEVLGPNWQSWAQSSTHEVSVSVTCRTCMPDKFASYWTHPCKFWELLPRQARDGTHCVSVHTGVQTWASDSYLTLTFCCVCLALWMSSQFCFLFVMCQPPWPASPNHRGVWPVLGIPEFLELCHWSHLVCCLFLLLVTLFC